MKQRAFGDSGIAVSEIGLGCWQLGGNDWGDLSEIDALRILQTAVDHGINFFDTADVYGNGRSEEIIGRFLKTCSTPVFVATKLGRFPQPGGTANFSLQVMRSHTEASLRRLGVEALDLTQLHCIPPQILRSGEVFNSLRSLQREGKIRRFGVSVESMEEAQLCLEQEGLTSLQIIFNIFRQKPIDTLFDTAKQKGVALIVRVPLASGLLTGKYDQSTQFSETDHRYYNRDGEAFNVGETFSGLRFETGVALAQSLKSAVPEGMSMAQMALRWCLDHDAVSVVIPGARTPQQAIANAAVSDLPPLSHDLHQFLSSFYHTKVADHIRGVY
jgi:aryl-alcohol dehydrogenase-like predicted oxidoreductase